MQRKAIAAMVGGITFVLTVAILSGQVEPPELTAIKVTTPPMIDGKADDAAWQQAKALDVTLKEIPGSNRERMVPCTLKSAYTDTHIYFLIRWKDATKNIFHKLWVWNQKTLQYEQSQDIEDNCALAFPLEGEFTADMLSGVEAVWDVWHWKAARTDPAGYAQDRCHIHAFQPSSPKAKEYRASNGKTIYIDRPEDQGRSTTMSQPKPTAFIATSIYQYAPQLPTESAADIRAKGEWMNGEWTVEIERRLLTGFDDDTQFDVTRGYPMGVAVHDAEEYAKHGVSGVIWLRFER